jgi:hypothetical protein
LELHSTSDYLRREGLRSEFANGFPNVSLLTKTNSGWIDEKFFLELAKPLAQSSRILPLTVGCHGSHNSLQSVKVCEKY